MTSFLVRAISPEIATTVRLTQRSPQYGHPVHRERATGTGPCRQCLSAFRVGEEDRLLFTFNPMRDAGVTAQPGPVFIHADHCAPFDGGGFPPGLPSIRQSPARPPDSRRVGRRRGLLRDSWSHIDALLHVMLQPH